MWFCALPFSHIFTTTANEFAPCCVAKTTKYNLHNDTIVDYFLSDEMNDVRKEMLSGNLDKTKYYCDKCIKMENNGQESYRKIWTEELYNTFTEEQKQDFNESLKFDSKFTPVGRQLTFKLSMFGNYCNLSCYTCLPINSSRRTSDLKKIGWLDEFGPYQIKNIPIENILEQIKPLLPYTHGFIMIGGEPLLIKSHYDLLDMLIESGHSKEIYLNYTTNLTLLKKDKTNFLDYVDKFKRIQINVSIDGLKERNEYIRYGSNWDTLINNYNAIHNMVDRRIYYTVSTLSIFECEKAYEYFNQEIADFILVDSPDFLSVRHLPDKIKQNFVDKLSDSCYNNIIKELKKDRVEQQWLKAINYIKKLDETRPVKAKGIFTELKDYL